ncbi:MAG: 1-acyl-sn-glycerol-3-phosphate acyltransferase [Armatimonadetes bacterium]|nr:1-acyl-sn-glycerol-3-phosphate acyltransferase [Armatimonadota bacterium]
MSTSITIAVFEPNPVYLLIRGGFRIFFRLFGSWRITGHENIPESGPVIIISNHVSYLDPPLMGSAVKRPVAYMAKRELFTQSRALAWVCRKLEAYPVRQGMADREALRQTYDRLNKGWMVGIFPEGHRSDSGDLQEFQPGMAVIALKSRAPVVPCGFCGTHEMLPPHAKIIHRSHIEVQFGPPLDLSDLYDAEDRKAAVVEATTRAHAAVSALVASSVSARESTRRKSL